MIEKEDCLLLLNELKNNGVLVDDKITQVLTSTGVPVEVLRFISKEKKLDIIEFYNYLRACSNKKKSTLYKNIVKEISTPDEVLTTLGALQLQILLYSNKLENKITFYRQSRAKEINQVLNNYFETFDLTNCINLLKLFKADIKCLESLNDNKN